jgi:outer membrane protein assembly factor BamB
MRAFFLLTLALILHGADWPQFRGPGGSGLCPNCGPMPVEFGPGRNVVWKSALPAGKSSPLFIGDRIFITAAEGDDLLTICLHRTNGKVLWRRAVRAAKREVQNPLNHRAAPTPATDGVNRVFAFFADFGLVAYDFDGKPLWQHPLGPFNSQHGIVASPVYADGRVILVCDQDTDAFILGVDAATGRAVWKHRREVINGYSTPLIHRPSQGPAQVIAPGSYQLTAYSVVDGKVEWFVHGLTCQPKSAPVIAGDVLYFSGWTPGNDAGEQVDLPPFADVIAKADANHDGKLAQSELPPPWQPTGSWRAIDLDRDGFLNEREWTFFRTRRASRNALLAIQLGGRGDVTGSHVLWRYEKSLPDVPTPLVYNGVVFLFRSGGIATSLDAKSGKVLKQARLMGALEDYYASPVAADGKIYIASEHGKVVVLRAAGDWEILAINDFDSDIYATPVVLDSRIYIRTQNALYALETTR